MAINPTGPALKRMIGEGEDGPVVMLNLLRFTGPSGRASYFEYLHHLTTTYLPRYGAHLVYFGEGSTVLVAEVGQDWDAVLLVEYPSRAAFSRMIADQDYQGITQLRTLALSEAVLQVTKPDLQLECMPARQGASLRAKQSDHADEF